MSDTSSSNTQGQRTSLAAAFKLWKCKVGAALNPIMERVETTTMNALGVWDLMPSRHPDYQELVDKLALVNEQVLQRISSNTTTDGATTRMTEALEKTAGEVEAFFRQSPESQAKRLAKGLNAPETIEKLYTRLDSIIAQFALVHTVQVGIRLERLEETASHALEVPADLSLVDIPAKPVHFYGRDELVTSIILLLLQDQPCRIPILGPGGIGKTSVAAAVLNDEQVKAKFRTYVIFVS